jgi:hypothetical protein
MCPVPCTSFPLGVDITNGILERWRKPATSLPSLTELRAVLDRSLPDDEKVPVRTEDFEQLLFPLPPDSCSKDDVAILFRLSETECSLYFRSLFTSVVTDSTHTGSETEASFHALWDGHIRRILQVLLPTGISIRDSCRNTSTGKLRPDYGFLLHNVCLFRGEEKAPYNPEDPKAELSDKLTWTYSPAPYIFGEPIILYSALHFNSSLFALAYHAVGTHVTLSAICAPREPSARPYVEDLAEANLALKRHRLLHLRRIIHLTRYFPLLLHLIGTRTEFDFLKIERCDSACSFQLGFFFCRNDKLVQVGLKIIRKEYFDPTRVDFLVKIYKLLAEKRVPQKHCFSRAEGSCPLPEQREGSSSPCLRSTSATSVLPQS